MKFCKDYVTTGEAKSHATYSILTGKYQGAKFRFNTLKIIDEKTHARVKFTYEVVKGTLEFDKVDLENNPDFESVISLILDDWLTGPLEKNDFRSDDPEEPEFV
jgi:hypothetical protein